jgi:hypothetical protein
MIKKFIINGVSCYSHYCQYFDEWVAWSSIPNHKPLYSDSQDIAVTELINEVSEYTSACSA